MSGPLDRLDTFDLARISDEALARLMRDIVPIRYGRVGLSETFDGRVRAYVDRVNAEMPDDPLHHDLDLDVALLALVERGLDAHEVDGRGPGVSARVVGLLTSATAVCNALSARCVELRRRIAEHTDMGRTTGPTGTDW